MELSPEQQKNLEVFSSRSAIDLARMVENEELLIKSLDYWVEKYVMFQNHPNLLEMELENLREKIKQCRAKMLIMKLCIQL